MLIFRIKSAPNGEGKCTEYVILEHALLWMATMPYRPGHTQICIHGGPGDTGKESHTFVTEESIESIMQRSL
jgi:hypothetical protein